VPALATGRPEIIERLTALARDGALGQAHLFVGPDGSGKEITALDLARRLQCPTPDACRETPSCESCRKALTFQHPDIRWIGPAPASIGEDDVVRLLADKQADPFHRPAHAASGEVLIGDPESPGPLTVRALLQFLRLKPFQGPLKVAVIDMAHRLRTGAANAFLKVLEEPPADSLIILCSAQAGGLLPTIRSRCQQVVFPPYSRQALSDLLRSVYDMDAERAGTVADAAAGNARLAARLLRPEPRLLRRWAHLLFEAIHEGRRGAGHQAAEMLHKGVLPPELVSAVNEEGGQKLKSAPLKDLARKRERALDLLDMLQGRFGELLRVRVGAVSETEAPASAATPRAPVGLIEDIRRIETARGDIDHNLNIGLTLAVLFQELIDHAAADAAAARA